MYIYWFDGRALPLRDVLPELLPSCYYKGKPLRQLAKHLLTARICSDAERMHCRIAAGFEIWAEEASYLVDSIHEFDDYENQVFFEHHKWVPDLPDYSVNVNYDMYCQAREQLGLPVQPSKGIPNESKDSPQQRKHFHNSAKASGSATSPNESKCSATSQQQPAATSLTTNTSHLAPKSTRKSNTKAHGGRLLSLEKVRKGWQGRQVRSHCTTYALLPATTRPRSLTH